MAQIEFNWTSGEGRRVSRLEPVLQPVVERSWRGQQLVFTGIGLLASTSLGAIELGLQTISKIPTIPNWFTSFHELYACSAAGILVLTNILMIGAIGSLTQTTSYDFSK